MDTRPLFLLSNDDGHRAEGLEVLATRLRAYGDVIVCAPETEQSTTSHSLTLTRPLRLRKVSDSVFAVDGTPADCVYLALAAGTRILPRRPDVVVSGMNHGLNLGSDVFYSGTVAAAREGALRGVPALATSMDSRADRDAAADLCARLAFGLSTLAREATDAAERTAQARGALDGVKPAPLLNVNVPPGAGGWNVVPTRLGLRVYDDIVEFRFDPRGREYVWLGGGGVRHGELAGSDTEAYDRGFASVTPLLLDLSAIEQAELSDRLVATLSRRT